MTETLAKNPDPSAWNGKIGAVDQRTWTFTPTCPSGPCDVDAVSTRVGAAASSGVKLQFVYANGTYTSTYVYPSDCTTTSKAVVKAAWTNTSVSMLTVTSVSADGGTATVIAGTQDLSGKASPAGSAAGCKGDVNGVEYALAGTPAAAGGAPPSGAPSPGLRLASTVTADKSCAKEKTTVAKGATSETKYTIINGTASVLSVFWIDYKGKREHWFDVQPGYQQEQKTFKTHPWVVADDAGRCLRLFYAPITVTVK